MTVCVTYLPFPNVDKRTGVRPGEMLLDLPGRSDPSAGEHWSSAVCKPVVWLFHELQYEIQQVGRSFNVIS